MNMKKIIYTVGAIIALTLLYGCSDSEKTGENATEIEAAKIAGRNAARSIITRHWDDTSLLRKEVERQRALRLRYDSIGHRRSAASFDSAFVSTVRPMTPILGKFVEKL